MMSFHKSCFNNICLLLVGQKILAMHGGAQQLNFFPWGETNRPFYAVFACMQVHNSLCRERHVTTHRIWYNWYWSCSCGQCGSLWLVAADIFLIYWLRLWRVWLLQLCKTTSSWTLVRQSFGWISGFIDDNGIYFVSSSAASVCT